MKYADLDGHVYEKESSQDFFLSLLYNSMAGRQSLKLLTRPFVSKLGGAFLSTRLSCLFIPGFIRRNKIDMSQYETKHYTSYNDFFTRKIKEGLRPLPEDKNILFSPCDSKVSAYRIDNDTKFTVKDTEYSVESLLRSKKAAKHYKGGYAVILRLTVDDYHRYCYIDDGTKGDNHFIKGVYHTVNPIANDYTPIYKENAREYTVLHTEHFGNVTQVEVGALMVGKIVNHHQRGSVKRGDEKGYFKFGGSTIVLLFEKDKVALDKKLLARTKHQCETKVRQGDPLGISLIN